MSKRAILADAKAIVADGIRSGLMRMPAKNTLLEAEIRAILHGERKH